MQKFVKEMKSIVVFFQCTGLSKPQNVSFDKKQNHKENSLEYFQQI